MVLGEVETAIRSVITSRFGIGACGLSDAIWACGFLCNGLQVDMGRPPQVCPVVGSDSRGTQLFG